MTKTEYEQLNNQRIDLIHRRHKQGLTEEETLTLSALEEKTAAYLETVAPLSMPHYEPSQLIEDGLSRI